MRRRVVCSLMILALALSTAVGCGGSPGENGSSGQQESVDGSGGEATGAGDEENGGEASGAGDEENGGEATGAEDDESGGEASGAEDEESGGQTSADGEEEVPILKDTVTDVMGCRIGAAATEMELKDPKVWEIITTHFNALTLGNELKPDAMFGYSNGRCPGTAEVDLNGETLLVPKLDYSRAERMLDKIYEWNQENPEEKIMVRGHVLVWHSQTPEWFFHVDYDKNKEYVDKETMNKRLEWYIRSMLTHFTGEDSKYKGMFYGWDVLNEAISDGTATYRSDQENPDEPLSNDTHGSNSSWWKVYQSNEYIINAFRYANKYAPPELELYYNDYNECDKRKLRGICELLTAVKEQEGEPGVGTRITAMGMQGHYSMSGPDMFDLDYAVREYAKIVGNVQLTEFDMKASDGYDGSEEGKAAEYEKEATRYAALYWALKEANKEEDINITGITFWGTVDHYSWLQSRSDVGGGASGRLPQCPLLFDDKYQPKPAFYVFAEK